MLSSVCTTRNKSWVLPAPKAGPKLAPGEYKYDGCAVRRRRFHRRHLLCAHVSPSPRAAATDLRPAATCVCAEERARPYTGRTAEARSSRAVGRASEATCSTALDRCALSLPAGVLTRFRGQRTLPAHLSLKGRVEKWIARGVLRGRSVLTLACLLLPPLLALLVIAPLPAIPFGSADKPCCGSPPHQHASLLDQSQIIQLSTPRFKSGVPPRVPRINIPARVSCMSWCSNLECPGMPHVPRGEGLHLAVEAARPAVDRRPV